ncbi:hypothetical protein ACFQ2Y_17270 [Streptomyces malaysiensis subsp. malaysiensis]
MSLRPAIRPAFGRSPYRLGRDVRFGSVGIAVQFVAWAAPMSVPWVIYDNASSPVDILLALTVPLIGPAVATPLLTRVQRQRFAALLGVGITGPQGPGGSCGTTCWPVRPSPSAGCWPGASPWWAWRPRPCSSGGSRPDG